MFAENSNTEFKEIYVSEIKKKLLHLQTQKAELYISGLMTMEILSDLITLISHINDTINSLNSVSFPLSIPDVIIFLTRRRYVVFSADFIFYNTVIGSLNTLKEFYYLKMLTTWFYCIIMIINYFAYC